MTKSINPTNKKPLTEGDVPVGSYFWREKILYKRINHSTIKRDDFPHTESLHPSAIIDSIDNCLPIDFRVFGAFEYRFRSLYEDAGKVSRLIERSKIDRSEKWKEELQQVLLAIADDIVILKNI